VGAIFDASFKIGHASSWVRNVLSPPAAAAPGPPAKAGDLL
jgi:hypothetical protein